MVRGRFVPALIALTLPVLFAAQSEAQTAVTTPMQQFGHEIGADYVLPNYTEFVAYWQKLANESDRMVLDTIGLTAEGRPQLMAIITSPDNHTRLDRYKSIARQLALAEGLTEAQAQALADEGRAVVWFDGGLHATEVLGAQQLMETVYQLVSRTDDETLRILDNVIILATHANPDGMELVSNWYMRNPEPTERRSGGLPVLYQKYVGHDNNRDFYASFQPESENINRVLYREWFPQIVYNHHQSGPTGSVMFAPPFRDPFNYNFDPLVPIGIDLVAAAMHSRFIVEGKPGVTMRSGASYSTWWNGGLRTTPYFHNMIGLLTETIGNPTPSRVGLDLDKQLPHGDMPYPIEPVEWHFRQSIDYSVTANYAVFDIASRRREEFLFGIYRMGMNSIEHGSQDYWTITPSDIERAEAAGLGRGGGRGGRGGGGGAEAGPQQDPLERYRAVFHDPAERDPRGYILPSDQPDFPTATKFINSLLENGVAVQRATSSFQVAGKTYPAGSYVVKTAQAFRPHVLDMFEPQDHPDDIPYPGAPPTRPYDVTGWTLAYQMGVQFDRIMDGFDGPFELITEFNASPMPGRIIGSADAGYLLSHAPNDAFVAVNRLLAADKQVFWLTAPVQAGGATFGAGTFFIPEAGGVREIIETVAREKGLNFQGVASRPNATALELQPTRIALWDRYGGSMPSGWTRWILEQFEFPFDVVGGDILDTADLSSTYGAIVFVSGAIPGGGGGGRGGGRGGGGGGGGGGNDEQDVPEQYRHLLGDVSAETTIPRLRAFLEDGGSVVTIGSSARNMADQLGLPIGDGLVRVENGIEQSVPSTEYYVPGSVLRARVDNTLPIAHGMGDYTDIFFDNSPVFRLEPGALESGVRPIAWFDTATPLRSGWAWGQEELDGDVIAIEATIGQGKLFMYGPEITFRAQPHGTFKLLFNGIYLPTAEATELR